ncbi:MAG: hypothetical protein SGI92_11965 [Bryobacteraceae bacterium]|nr:hypothetical protein [Bryobacteraceae bacterium]
MATADPSPTLRIHEATIDPGAPPEAATDPSRTPGPPESRRARGRAKPRPDVSRRVAADSQMQLLMVDDPLVRASLEQRARELSQELTRLGQTALEERLVEQTGVAWSCQAGLKYRVRQPDLSGRYRNELRKQYNVAFEHFERCLHELRAIREAIITKVSTQQADQGL